MCDSLLFGSICVTRYCLAVHGWLVIVWQFIGGAFGVCRDGMLLIDAIEGGCVRFLFDGKWGEGEDSMLKDDICQKNLG